MSIFDDNVFGQPTPCAKGTSLSAKDANQSTLADDDTGSDDASAAFRTPARGALIGPSAGSLQGGAATGGRRQSTSSTSSQSSSGSSAITPRVLELVNEVHAWAEKYKAAEGIIAQLEGQLAHKDAAISSLSSKLQAALQQAMMAPPAGLGGGGPSRAVPRHVSSGTGAQAAAPRLMSDGGGRAGFASPESSHSRQSSKTAAAAAGGASSNQAAATASAVSAAVVFSPLSTNSASSSSGAAVGGVAPSAAGGVEAAPLFTPSHATTVAMPVDTDTPDGVASVAVVFDSAMTSAAEGGQATGPTAVAPVAAAVASFSPSTASSSIVSNSSSSPLAGSVGDSMMRTLLAAASSASPLQAQSQPLQQAGEGGAQQTSAVSSNSFGPSSASASSTPPPLALEAQLSILLSQLVQGLEARLSGTLTSLLAGGGAVTSVVAHPYPEQPLAHRSIEGGAGGDVTMSETGMTSEGADCDNEAELIAEEGQAGAIVTADSHVGRSDGSDGVPTETQDGGTEEPPPPAAADPDAIVVRRDQLQTLLQEFEAAKASVEAKTQLIRSLKASLMELMEEYAVAMTSVRDASALEERATTAESDAAFFALLARCATIDGTGPNNPSNVTAVISEGAHAGDDVSGGEEEEEGRHVDASENSAHNRQQQQQQQQPDLLLRIYHSRRHRAAGYVAPRQAAVTSSGRGAASAGKRRREDTNASTDDGEGEGSPSKRSRITSAASKKPTVSVGTCTSEDAEAMSSDVVLLQSRLDDVTAEAAATVEMNEAVLTQLSELRAKFNARLLEKEQAHAEELEALRTEYALKLAQQAKKPSAAASSSTSS